MTERITEGTWVEIHRVVLNPQQRAPQVPVDTGRVAFEMRIKGFLARAAAVGEEVEIITAAGRPVSGTLTAVNPAYTHSFGSPLAELSTIGNEVREMIRERKP